MARIYTWTEGLQLLLATAPEQDRGRIEQVARAAWVPSSETEPTAVTDSIVLKAGGALNVVVRGNGRIVDYSLNGGDLQVFIAPERTIAAFSMQSHTDHLVVNAYFEGSGAFGLRWYAATDEESNALLAFVSRLHGVRN